MKDASDTFYQTIWPHAATLLRVAQVLCRSEADAEDLVQETLLKAYRHLDQFKEGTDARRWLLTILRNTRIDRVRTLAGRQAEISIEQAEIDPAAPAREWAADTSDAWADPRAMLESLSDQTMIEALLELPEEIRWSLLLVDVEGLEMADAAGIMEIPVGTVKSRLHRGRGMLRERLQARVESGSAGAREGARWQKR
jgi:RNA polymerase sigma-70 factor (ECF subfamily)